ncbi:MAG: hypothetical protein LBD35_04225 [Prevotellaceae bacterium]|jgi:hypothetical protein|nr:hypothetical protein [Prevotellaceae bacterium]
MKNLRIAAIIALCTLILSCQRELDNWHSETFDYSGRFVYAQEDAGLHIEDGYEIHIYNSSANIASEIWIDDASGLFPFKGKFKVTGAPADFSGEKTKNEKATLQFFNGSRYVNFTQASALAYRRPTAAGQRLDGYAEYAHVTLDAGKIIPNGATTIGGNRSDSLYLKISLHSSETEFVSYEIDSKLWTVPGVPEYEWKHDPDIDRHDPDADESYELKGYRYTGYPEDM